MTITLNHLRKIHQSMYLTNTHHLSHRTFYHQLLLSAKSSLISRNRCLSLTMDNIIHPITTKSTDAQPTGQYYLYIFLSPYKRSPYLQYTYDGGYHNNYTVSAQRLTITTRLPSSLISSTRQKRRCMMHTSSYTPDPGQTLTFPWTRSSTK